MLDLPGKTEQQISCQIPSLRFLDMDQAIGDTRPVPFHALRGLLRWCVLASTGSKRSR